jgi:hypothetical protein
MADNISKICSDYLRECYPGLKASHAHELVAAFFGYKSHAALLADKSNFVDFLDQAEVLVPDACTIDERRYRLKELFSDLPRSNKLVEDLTQFVQGEELFTGEVWECIDIGEFLLEEYLPEHLSPKLDFELEDVVATTNAIFEDISYDDAAVDETEHGITVTLIGTYSGYSLDEDADSGDTIDMEITVFLRRCAGRISFDEPEIDVVGTLHRDDAVDEGAPQQPVVAKT